MNEIRDFGPSPHGGMRYRLELVLLDREDKRQTRHVLESNTVEISTSDSYADPFTGRMVADVTVHLPRAASADGQEDASESALVWTREKPTASAYYWLRTTGYERGIVVWVFVGAGGGLFIDHPINRYVDVIGGWWAGPLPEPAWPVPQDKEDA